MEEIQKQSVYKSIFLYLYLLWFKISYIITNKIFLSTKLSADVVVFCIQCTDNKFCYVKFEFIYSRFIFYQVNICLYHYISFMCTKLYFSFYIPYRVITTKNLPSICHHRVGSLPMSPFSLPFPSGNQYCSPYLHVFVFVSFAHLFCFFVCLY